MRWLYAPATADEHAAGAAVDAVLACLDFRSLQQLTSVSRSAARSPLRQRMLRRAIVPLSADSLHVHAVLARMALRRHLRAVEIANCWQLPSPQRAAELAPLLAAVESATFATAAVVLEHDKATAAVHSDAFVRRVRRRVTPAQSDTRLVAQHMLAWLALLPRTLAQLDLGELHMDDLAWITRFPALRTLALNASAERASSAWLDPLASVAATLHELVLTRLPFATCPALGTLTSLRRLELRGAAKLDSLEFLRRMPRLEKLVLTDVRRVVDLAPVLALASLSQLTLDTVGVRGHVTLASSSSSSLPSLDRLQRLEVLFTQPDLTQLLPRCRHLRDLSLCQARVDDWAVLRGLARLESIAIHVDGVDDWSPLASLPRLRRLSLDSNQGRLRGSLLGRGWPALEEVVSPPWDDYAPLVAAAGATLTTLHLIGWRDRDSSPLAALRLAPRLESLWIAFVEGAVDLSALGELRQLRRLHLWCASVVSIEFLRPLRRLVELEMPCPMASSASIVDFSPLGALMQLKTLVLRGRPEFNDRHVESLATLASLTTLDLQGTSVTRRRATELARRATLPGLRHVAL